MRRERRGAGAGKTVRGWFSSPARTCVGADLRSFLSAFSISRQAGLTT